MFQTHELVALLATAIPGLVTQVLETLAVEMDASLEVWTLGIPYSPVKRLGLSENVVKFLV